TRHRANLFSDVITRANKHRIDHRLRGQRGFSYEIPQPLTPPKPAHTVCWKGHKWEISDGGLRTADVGKKLNLSYSLHRPSEIRHPTSLKQSLSGPECAVGTDILQRKSEAKTALFAGANVELTEFEAQAVTVGIIANLCDRALEK